MKLPKPLFTVLLLLLYIISSGQQVQWYQNQDGNNAPPYGTIGTSVQSLNSTSFVACYIWSISNDQYAWKISKTNTNGQEQKTFFVTGTTALAEAKVGKNAIYVFKRDFPLGQNPQYTIYKLDYNLNVITQKTIEFPNGFNIFTMNAFELDNSDNVYFAGDGQYPDGPGFSPASFVVKKDKNLVTKWSKMDSTQASYTRLHIDHNGYVIVINDFYTFFPDVRIKVISPNGQHSYTNTITTDAGRYSLFSAFDDDENLLLYGGKQINDTTQAMYLYKVSRYNGNVYYRKTLFTATATQLMDLKVDDYGNIYTLIQQYLGPDNQLCKVSRINSNNGSISWNRNFKFQQDSCDLYKMVMNDGDKFYLVGQRRCNTYFSRGYVQRMRKNGNVDGGSLGSPDSVCYMRSHWLSDGIIDHSNRLIAIGGTQDLDTITFMNSYLRAFAIRFNESNHHNDCDNFGRVVATEEEEILVPEKLVIYPNPAQSEITIGNIQPGEYDQLSVYNMQGILVRQQLIKGTAAFVDVSTLGDGIYVVTLRSSVMKKEKSMKFVVKK